MEDVRVRGLWDRYTAPGTKYRTRRQAVSRARQDGRYGPTVWDVLPAFVLLLAVVAGPVALLAWLHAVLGPGGLALGVVLLTGTVVPLVRWRRAVARRRSGIWTAAELQALDDRQLPAAVLTLLRRDGWRMRKAPHEGRPRLLGGHPSIRIRIDVGFRLSGEGASDAPAPGFLRVAGREHVGGIVRLVVNRGEFSRTDVHWANRQGGVHLLDGHQLATWAAGLPLQKLLGLTAAADETPGGTAEAGG
ncbi:hypothetical protein [Streptomyces sp. NPDC088733]|uniref:hypothetical protein n=1 Tax=Streptomyces sp. NPDC088733 TaxID=3365880 RepID=UPI003827C9EE